ncbi:MAG: hypothetical protein RMJ15_06805 [Nitrososphaerota archaeon]|nr:hypothetical protein [Candidatus Bathyarchaeota archaeon]MDW8023427.1 hypothetical protein [Nitrososphaerota archaeon]
MSDEDLRIFLEDFCDFVSGVEACCVKLRKQIGKLLGSEVKAKLSEETFLILKWQSEKGSRLGDYEVAYKSQNVLENWQHCFNILKQNNAVIGNPFHEEGYRFRYWIYPEKYGDRIFRKKLSEVKG